MKSIILAVAMFAATTPPTQYVTCHCPLGHTDDAGYWAEHEDDNWGVIPPIEWWHLYLPEQTEVQR